MLANVVQAVQAVRVRRGYTTLFACFPKLVQIDPKTRRVVRRVDDVLRLTL